MQAGSTALRYTRGANALAASRYERWRPRERSSSTLSNGSGISPAKRSPLSTAMPLTRSLSDQPQQQIRAATTEVTHLSRSLLIPPFQQLAPLVKQSVTMRDRGDRSNWQWSALLGCGAAAVVAAASTSSSATDASRAEAAAAAGDSGTAPPKPVAEAATDASTSGSKALRKRKTSTGNERFVISSAAVRGDRAKMEDASYVSGCKRFAAVFDGHGGAAVAEYLRGHYFAQLAPAIAKLDEESAARNAEALLMHVATVDESRAALPPHLLSPGVPRVVTPFARRNEILTLLKSTMEHLDADVLQRNEWKYQGSTAVAVLLYDDVVYTLNVGDCRAVLCRSGDAVELTRDHKPNDPSEQSRIESLGGTVKWHGYVDAQGVPIEPYGAYRINGNLAVARAIGDRDLRPFVTGEPEVKAFKRDESRDEFIVLASDGLWDVFTSDEVVTFVKDVMSGELGGRESWRSGAHSDTRVPIFEWSHQYKSDRGMIKAARKRRKLQIANYLVQEALYRGTSDNVSVIVVWLR